MVEFLDIVLHAGRSGVELALFILLPVMVVMLALMRLLEAKGVLDKLVILLAPLLRPLGLTGLGVFAAMQISFVSFAAPVATLAMMEQRGASDRHIAATLAMVMAMAQANVVLPMSTMGLSLGTTMLFSLIGGLVAATASYHVFGRHLSNREGNVDETLKHPVADDAKGVLDVINRAGAEAFKITIGAIPMLVLALVTVAALRNSGAITALTALIAPLLTPLGIDTAMVLPTLTKYLGGGTAMMGVMGEMLRDGSASVATLNASIGFLLHPLDIPGIAVLISAGKRVASVWKVALMAACVGVAVRTLAHVMLF
ncbi:nucleoside recognition domain-containing protein [Nitrogeniibacter aestuarii]|uniref:nucleoside recognition domain-containing protein n=1 Tax=Nitrogeniibacter aestuarii TaxID=2815343 RepID=UPI001D12923E|nr:nucleoside recognition domain-containing protein [Nitrogeniibacter aestuarii]